MRSKIDINLLKRISIAVGTFMILAHMYAFTNGPILFDAVGVYRGDASFQVSSDRWAGGLYWWMDLGVNAPWLAGVWATVLMIVIVYCICDIWGVNTICGIVFASGLCATHTAVISEQLYTGQNFYILIPLFEAVLSAWIIRKSNLHLALKALSAIVLIALSAGTYGAMVSMMPAVLLVAVILDIINGRSARENWNNSIQYVGIFIGGMTLYYCILRILLHVQGGEIQSYMGEDAISSISVVKSMILSIPSAYANIFRYYAGKSRFLPEILNKIMIWLMIFGGLEFVLLIILYRNKIQDEIQNGILLAIAACISPAVLNLIYIMSLGNVHFLMIFTYSVPLLFFVRVNELMVERVCEQKTRYTVYLSRILYVFFLYFSVVMSNASYINYQQMYIETISIGTRMLDRIETCDGFKGTEKVVILGAMQDNAYWGTPGEQPAMILNAFLGSGNPNNINGINYASWTRRFLTNVLDSSMEMVSYSTFAECIQEERLSDDEIERFQEMAAFPRDGSVEKIGDRIFVKLADNVQ